MVSAKGRNLRVTLLLIAARSGREWREKGERRRDLSRTHAFQTAEISHNLISFRVRFGKNSSAMQFTFQFCADRGGHASTAWARLRVWVFLFLFYFSGSSGGLRVSIRSGAGEPRLQRRSGRRDGGVRSQNRSRSLTLLVLQGFGKMRENE